MASTMTSTQRWRSPAFAREHQRRYRPIGQIWMDGAIHLCRHLRQRQEYSGPPSPHIAMRMLRRLGIKTSDFGRAQSAALAPAKPSKPTALRTFSDADALEAFVELDAFLRAEPFTARISRLEGLLAGADRVQAAEIAAASQMSIELVEAALLARERIGLLDSVIHASVITQVIPLILEEGEQVLIRPSLGAGNDAQRHFDLETDRRVAEFKLSSWKGADGGRKRALFADLRGLTLDETTRKRQLFVVGPRPKTFLETSRQNAARTLAKSALRLRDSEMLPEGLPSRPSLVPPMSRSSTSRQCSRVSAERPVSGDGAAMDDIVVFGQLLRLPSGDRLVRPSETRST